MMIRNLLFDLGGVIMDIERDRCVASFRRLGMEHPEDMLDAYCQRGPFLGVEDGTYSPAEFRAELRRFLPDGVTDAQIDDAFQDFLIGIPTHRLRELDRLHKRYRIYMISNTNPIMWHGRIASEFRKDGHAVDYYFDGMVTSFEARCVKPGEAIFRLCIERFGIDPAETLFFDDSHANIAAAEALGFCGAEVAEGSEFVDILNSVLAL